MSENKNIKTIYFAGGCFWGMQKLMQSLKGVAGTAVGYANGKPSLKPVYELVKQGQSGYKETVKVDYNPQIIPLENLLKAYFFVTDVTVTNRQGHDEGPQYQTGIYYTEEADKPSIDKIANEERKKYDRFMVQIEPLSNFFKAEEYHQDYLIKNPSGYCHISPSKMLECKEKLGL